MMLPLTTNQIGGRSESMAYPATSNFSSKVNYYIRFHSKGIMCCLAFFSFVVVISSDFAHKGIKDPL